MEFKIVIADTKTGKSYQREVTGPETNQLRNKKIGDKFEGRMIGLEGYTMEITGGSDKSGFPMKKGMHRVEKRILMKEGSGYNAKRKERKRKRVLGEVISENIVQINTKIIKNGKKSVEELLGVKKEADEGKEKEAPAKKEKPKEEKEVEKKGEKKVVKGTKPEEESRGSSKKEEDKTEKKIEESKKEESTDKTQEKNRAKGGK